MEKRVFFVRSISRLTTVTTGPARVETGPFDQPHTLTGQFHKLREFRSTALGNERDVLVHLPPGYEEDTDRRYPVLYMHDGQNLFDGATAFGGQEWHLDETADGMIAAGQIEPLIIVGINHAGEDRMHELTPTASRKHKAGGRGPSYAKFLFEELKPFIDTNYRTRPEREHTATGGASLGGLIALYLGFAVPDVFSRLMVMSPSLWWDRRAVLQELRAASDKLPLKIWLDAGTNEGGGTLQNVRMLKNALIRRGWAPGVDLRYLEAQGADHSEAAWAARAGSALEFLFGRSA
jgi:predicted alpha/beta superfamily hydrolase